MSISETLIERLERIAEQQGKTPEDVLTIMLDEYEYLQRKKDTINNYIGMFDDDVTDLSSTVSETLRKRFGEDNDLSS